jgi:hypothetical protein
MRRGIDPVEVLAWGCALTAASFFLLVAATAVRLCFKVFGV